jgi:hypothetical protein
MGPPDVNMLAKFLLEIALETLIPPPPASKRGSSHLIFAQQDL